MVVDIETQVETVIETDWGLGSSPDEDTSVLVKFTGSMRPQGVVANKVYILLFPVEPPIVSGVTRGFENLLYEGFLIIYAFNHANCISAIDELVRIGNAHSNATAGEILKFKQASPRGDRKKGDKFWAEVPWSWRKNAVARAT